MSAPPGSSACEASSRGVCVCVCILLKGVQQASVSLPVVCVLVGVYSWLLLFCALTDGMVGARE